MDDSILLILNALHFYFINFLNIERPYSLNCTIVGFVVKVVRVTQLLSSFSSAVLAQAQGCEPVSLKSILDAFFNARCSFESDSPHFLFITKNKNMRHKASCFIFCGEGGESRTHVRKHFHKNFSERS